MMERMVSAGGVLVLMGLAWALSVNRRRVPWRIVLWGVGLQFGFGLWILRTESGRWVFGTAGRAVNKLMDFTSMGSSFVFGPLAEAPGGASSVGFVFAFQILPTVIFVGALTSVLYHLGILQRVVGAMAWLMMKTMGSSGAESLSCAANVFVGQTEAPLIIRPYLASMTRSELMTVMAGGFASVAGGVLVAYVGILQAAGIEGAAGHLLAASVMSAPAAIVMAKLMIPETEVPRTRSEVRVSEGRQAANVLDAAATGASDGLKLALNVAGMLIAFIALIAFLDWLLQGGDRVLATVLGYGVNGGDYCPFFPQSLTSLFGKVLWPLGWAMGVPAADCRAFASLIGEMIAVNEFVAYLHLRDIVAAGGLSPRGALMATYALCGFANFASIAIQLGGIGALVPERRGDLARLGLRAMFAGALANLQTAVVAGVIL